MSMLAQTNRALRMCIGRLNNGAKGGEKQTFSLSRKPDEDDQFYSLKVELFSHSDIQPTSLKV
jgi:hypothetical protein